MKNLITQTEKEHIDMLCVEYNIKNYTINNDGSIDVDGDICFGGRNLYDVIPLKFGKVTGYFDVCDSGITSLVNSPTYVGKTFYCYRNKLTSLDNAPKYVGGAFNCTYTLITTLEGAPSYIGGALLCFDTKLISLYSGNTDIILGSGINASYTNLPRLIIDNQKNIIEILKYQRHFEIWNDDLSLNEVNFEELIEEIKDGLR